MPIFKSPDCAAVVSTASSFRCATRTSSLFQRLEIPQLQRAGISVVAEKVRGLVSEGGIRKRAQAAVAGVSGEPIEPK